MINKSLLNKGFIVPVLIGVIAILVAGGGVYIYKNKKAEAPIVTSDKIPEEVKKELVKEGEDKKVEITSTNIYKDTQLKKFASEKFSFYAPSEWREDKTVLTESGKFTGCELYSIDFGGDGHAMGGVVGIYLNSCVETPKIPAGPIKENIHKDGYYIFAMYDKDSGTTPTEELKTKEVYKKVVETFTVNKTMNLKVFFRKGAIVCSEKNINTESFNRTVPPTQATAKAAINELLKGPTEAEKSKGYWSDIPAGTMVKSINIVNGEAKIDFNEKMMLGLTTCNSGATRVLQVRQTLLQFPTINTVKILINGDPQP